MNIRLLVHMTIVGAASILVGTQVLHGQTRTQPTKFETVKVKDDLFVFYNPTAPGNSIAMVTDQGVVLVDDKDPQDFANVVAAVKAVTSQPIRYVINTHHHGDHTGSNAAMQNAGAVIVASENARQNMIESRFPGQPSITFEQRANVILGGKKVELYYFGRGHTNGDIVAYFPAQRAVATGDLYVTGVGELIDYAAGGSGKEWTRTLDGVLGLDFDIAIPGHGVVAKKDDVRKFRESTLALRNRIHDMVARNAPPADVEKVLRTEFNWGTLHVGRGLLGVMAEMREMP